MTGRRVYKIAKLFAWLGLISVVLVLVTFFILIWGQVESPQTPPQSPSGVEPSGIGFADAPLITFWLSSFCALIATIGTASTILLGWRVDRRHAETDRRQAEQGRLKIAQLEFQLAEVRAKAEKTSAPA